MYLHIVGPVGSSAPTSQPPNNEVAEMTVFGDSDFIANGNVHRGSSAALFLNTANYLMGDFSLVSIRDREFIYRSGTWTKMSLILCGSPPGCCCRA